MNLINAILLCHFVIFKVVNELKKLANREANVYQLDDSHMFIVEFTSGEILWPDIAYVVTTSGSTGIPKIVYVPNKSIVPNIFDVVLVSRCYLLLTFFIPSSATL